jgi:hypothetical protein
MQMLRTITDRVQQMTNAEFVVATALPMAPAIVTATVLLQDTIVMAPA